MIASEPPPQCSTPFGITEVGTVDSRDRSPSAWVLNAFRHHRGGHMSVSQGRRADGDVLNAFRHHRGGHFTAGWPKDNTANVLNAFRHH